MWEIMRRRVCFSERSCVRRWRAQKCCEIDALCDYRRKKAEYQKPQTGRFRRGIGMSLQFHGGGFTGSGEQDIIKGVSAQYRKGVCLKLLEDSLRQHCTIRLRHLLENLCPDFVTFS